jgi:hypothetical protein
MATDIFEWRPPTPRNLLDRWSEDQLIDSAVALYRERVSPSYRTVTRPDRINRGAPEIDAIVTGVDVQQLAIEHTNVEAFAGQLLDDRRVHQLLSAFQGELSNELPTGLWCIIPTHAFVSGFDWAVVRQRIAEYLLATAPTLQAGTGSVEIPGVPFTCFIKYDPQLRTAFRFGRAAPTRDDISRDLLATTEKAVLHKKARLAEYRSAGYRTVLLLEYADMSLLSWIEPYQAFLAAEESIGSEHAQDVLFAQTDDPNCIYWYGFKGEDSFLDNLNPPNLKLGGKYRRYWLKAEPE